MHMAVKAIGNSRIDGDNKGNWVRVMGLRLGRELELQLELGIRVRVRERIRVRILGLGLPLYLVTFFL